MYQTKTYKGAFGWKSETVIDLTDDIRICILTMKRSSGGILTSAIGGVKCPRTGYYMITAFKDYSKKIILMQGKATKNAIMWQQQQALADLDDIVADAKQFYKIPVDSPELV